MKCQYCGGEMLPEDKFCRNCGAEQPKQPEPPEPAPAEEGRTRWSYGGGEATDDHSQWTEQQRDYQRRYQESGKMPRRKRGFGCLLPLLLGIVLVVAGATLGGWLLRGAGHLLDELRYGSYSNSFGSYFVDDDYSATGSNSYGHASLWEQWAQQYFGGGSADSQWDSATVGLYGSELNDASFRANYTSLRGNGNDRCTLLVYIVGADLESDYGCASEDIAEMLRADLGDKVNLIIQTGGARYWQDRRISNGATQRWQVENGQLHKLADLGRRNMASSDTLADFISYGTDNFPADRYGLILWNHGGGSVYGFGFDQLYNDDCLLLPEIDAALDLAGVKFDLIGFDACLMATLETACLLEPYADYLVASQRTEPEAGWYYTDWLNALGQNSSISSVELGRRIIDSFNSHNGAENTLSLISLREIPLVYQRAGQLLTAAQPLLDSDYYRVGAALRATADMEEGYDLYDLRGLAAQLALPESAALSQALDSAVKYRNNCSVSGIGGLSLYLPYQEVGVYDTAASLFSQFDFGGGVAEFSRRLVNLLAYGRSKNSGHSSVGGALSGTDSAGTDFSAYDWYDPDAMANAELDAPDYAQLTIFWSEAQQWYYLPLSAENWQYLAGVEMQVLLDDGEGYIDLGSDDSYQVDDAGNLVLDYGSDCTWVALDGQVVPYYAETQVQTAAGTVYRGTVPAVLNGDTDIELVLRWDDAHPEGYVAGYRLWKEAPGAAERRLAQLQAGDTLDYLFDCYSYDGEYDASYYLYDSYTVGDTPPQVSYEYVGDYPVLQCYLLTDLYGSYVWTESVMFSLDDGSSDSSDSSKGE